MASDHTAVRRVMHPIGDEQGHVRHAADRRGNERRTQRSMVRRPRLRPTRRAGAMVTRATNEPPNQRPSTICHVGVGESQVKWNVPDRTSAPEHGVADHQCGDRHHQSEDPFGGDVGERPLGSAGVDRVGEQAEQQRAGAGNSTANHRFGGTHDCSV